MTRRHGQSRIHPDWWAALLVVVLVAVTLLAGAQFSGSFHSYVPVTLFSERAGLVMEAGAKVKMRGVQVGRVAQVAGGDDPVSLQLDIDPDVIRYIPANVQARIAATTVFGAKYVDLIYPSHPSPQPLRGGEVLTAQNVTAEVNTVFQNLVGVIDHLDPQKLNAILSAIAEGVRGQGERIGEATTAADEVLRELNSRSDSIRADWRALGNSSEAYSAAASDLIAFLDAASTTSTTLTGHSADLDSLLLNVSGFAYSGIGLLGQSKDNLVRAIDVLAPTTGLLMEYNPELTCLILGGKVVLDKSPMAGSNGKSIIVDAALLLGDDPYRYPENLPINGAKGGPGGKPGCGSLPDVADNWPVRRLIANTGFGTGLDNRPNPGIGFPGYADYLPVTRALPEPPIIRNPGGPAPGPIPPPGSPPYGAPMGIPGGAP
ncbi:MAG: MCE family protein [Mycobacterium sp.]